MFSVLDQVPIQPEMVTSFRDAQGDMPADETPAWSSSVGYALGAEVHRVETQTVHFAGDRELVRAQTVAHALEGLLERAVQCSA